MLEEYEYFLPPKRFKLFDPFFESCVRVLFVAQTHITPVRCRNHRRGFLTGFTKFELTIASKMPATSAQTAEAAAIREYLAKNDLRESDWSDERQKYPEHSMRKPIDKNSYLRGRLVDLGEAKRDSNWTIDKPDWSNIPGSFRSRFAKDLCLHSTEVGAQTELDFSGTAIGLYVLAGPDAGRVEFSIDGSDYREADLFHHFSRGLHYPRTVMLDADLEPGDHHVVIRVAKTKHDDSTGNAIRILNFVTN